MVNAFVQQVIQAQKANPKLTLSDWQKAFYSKAFKDPEIRSLMKVMYSGVGDYEKNPSQENEIKVQVSAQKIVNELCERAGLNKGLKVKIIDGKTFLGETNCTDTIFLSRTKWKQKRKKMLCVTTVFHEFSHVLSDRFLKYVPKVKDSSLAASEKELKEHYLVYGSDKLKKVIMREAGESKNKLSDRIVNAKMFEAYRGRNATERIAFEMEKQAYNELWKLETTRSSTPPKHPRFKY